MDFTTIIGIVGGFGVIIAGILNGGELGNFIDTGSVLITIGGTICAVIASFPANLLKNIPKHMKKLIKADKYSVEELIDTMVEFSQTARANGLLALEEKANALEDPFMKKGVLFVVDAMETEKIRATFVIRRRFSAGTTGLSLSIPEDTATRPEELHPLRWNNSQMISMLF